MKVEPVSVSLGRSRRDIAIAGAIIALLAVAALWPVVVGDRSFFHSDLRYEVVPMWHASQQAILKGESPFWLPGQYCGHPTLMLQEVPLLYPLTIPMLVSGAHAHRLADLFSLFHFWLAGFAMFVLARRVGADAFSALFSGIAWMLSGRLIQSALWPNAVAVSALLPLLVLGLVSLGARQRRFGILLAAIAGGIALLAFRPHVLVGAAPLLLGTTLAVLKASRRYWGTLADIIRAAAFAAVIGAPALLPAMALYPESSRASGLTRGERNLWPVQFDGDLDQVLFPVGGRPRWPEAGAYSGFAVGVLFLVGVVFAFQRSHGFPRVLFSAIAWGGFIGLAFAFGEAGPYGLFADLPILRSLRVPARFLVSWSFALALGSGLTLTFLLRHFRRRSLVGFAAVSVLSVDLIWYARQVAPTRPSELYTVVPESASLLRKTLSTDEAGFPHRYWSFSPSLIEIDYASDSQLLWRAHALEPLARGLGMRFGLDHAGGPDSPTLDRSQTLLETPSHRIAQLVGAASIVEWVPREIPPQADRVPRPPSRQLVISNLEVFPRAVLATEVKLVQPSAAMRAVLEPSFDPRRTVVLEGVDVMPRMANSSPGDSSVRLLSRETGRLELTTESSNPGVLVVSESYEKGWAATVDGRSEKVVRANAAFLGVPISAGKHVVRLEYCPRGLREGLAVAVIGLLGLLVWTTRLPLAEDDRSVVSA